jgi:hypothetical protein
MLAREAESLLTARTFGLSEASFDDDGRLRNIKVSELQ